MYAMYQTRLLSSTSGEGIMGLASTPDGSVWVGFASASPGSANTDLQGCGRALGQGKNLRPRRFRRRLSSRVMARFKQVSRKGREIGRALFRVRR